MIDAGEPSDIPPSTIERIYTLSPDERAAEFALELAYEGQTFRGVLRVVRFVTCKPAIRTAFVGVAAATVGTPASAAAVASFLATHISWITLYPPAAVAAVVGLIIVLGVEGFCTWSGNSLKNYTKSQDQITGSPVTTVSRQSGKPVLKCQALVSR